MLLMLLLTAAVASSSTMSLPNCPDKCGDVTIPFPFGIGLNCSRDASFEINCISENNKPPKAFLPNSSIEVTEIPYFPYVLGQARVQWNFLSWRCYAKNQSGDTIGESRPSIDLNVTVGPVYRFSHTRNLYTTVGCDSYTYIKSTKTNTNPYGYRYYMGCTSFCSGLGDIINGSCSGIGCCQSSIMPNLSEFIFVNRDDSFAYDIVDYSPCTYGFLADKDWFNFTSASLRMDVKTIIPMWFDWAVRDYRTCTEAQLDAAEYACRSNNSQCLSSPNGPGYICNCSQGYQGNPYLVDGCQDIDECKFPQNYPCLGKCTNTPGSYECTCPPGTHGDKPKEEPCTPNFPLALKLVTGLSVGIVGMLIITILVLMEYQKRKLKRVRKEFFEKNGGSILMGKLQSKKVEMPIMIFTEDELKKATDNFAKGKLLGEGGRGEVYLGILKEHRVAVKKAKLFTITDQEGEFANEIYILSQVNHKNVVKLLGCCLEVDVPMLVYEYVQGGSLYEFLHGGSRRPISLSTRLSIAIESAEALAQLHSFRPDAIIHGDVKSLNILLDERWQPKVADFGASQQLTANDAQFAALVQGTYGYLDPEVMQTHRLTEKSDVYSFGVVILELFTRQKAFTEESGDKKSLATIFKSAMRENKQNDILDAQIRSEGGVELFGQIAELVLRCLSYSGEERPTMKEVAEGLQDLGRFQRQSSMQHESMEIESLGLVESSIKHHTLDTSGLESVEAKALLNIDTGR